MNYDVINVIGMTVLALWGIWIFAKSAKDFQKKSDQTDTKQKTTKNP